MDLNYWVFVAEVWLVIGLILIISDIFLGFNFFVLPVGVAALIMSVLVYSDNNAVFDTFYLFDTWRVVILSFAALSVASVLLLKFLFQRKKKDEPDINIY